MATYHVQLRNRDTLWRWVHHATYRGHPIAALTRAREAAQDRCQDTGDQTRVIVGQNVFCALGGAQPGEPVPGIGPLGALYEPVVSGPGAKLWNCLGAVAQRRG
jgi:hypothetical protein